MTTGDREQRDRSLRIKRTGADKATPRPWAVGPSYTVGQRIIAVKTSESIVQVYGKTESESIGNARLIVKAVNCHDDLLAALRLYYDLHHERTASPADAWTEAHGMARAALKKAED